MPATPPSDIKPRTSLAGNSASATPAASPTAPATPATPVLPESPESPEPLASDAEDSSIFEWTPAPWKELKHLQYGADRSLAHVIENEVLTAAPSSFRALENRLLGVLKDPTATLAARDFVCRMLSLIGSAASVPVLTPMLKNPKTEHLARLALERIQPKART